MVTSFTGRAQGMAGINGIKYKHSNFYLCSQPTGMPSINFTDISYLKKGSATQHRVYNVLLRSKLLDKLAAYDPILVGTFPLDIQTSNSDIDIICQCKDLKAFAQMISTTFADQDNFSLKTINGFDLPAVIASFITEGIPVEIFAQDLPPTKQNGYLHMLAEHQILSYFGEDFKQKVVALKETGIKTEPAFCQLLGISGNPYIELLNYQLPISGNA
ncbi:DUF4269 domain-containing protein [Mucilaginibacter pallidiroseus]|uniref:DUF4269 domain-containing protein n=1 Tax=Mucilaginibacter pallidiroseus TaxID=2599295 RepID=A0A563UHW9_9SPHI|nr:DUF4269 domain-containing protein [Mucilaginibacter pallidiroseus]TWR30967.1 DUF4269 domain-containing protein [Mucilaginibacter pallidiroseus]